MASDIQTGLSGAAAPVLAPVLAPVSEMPPGGGSPRTGGPAENPTGHRGGVHAPVDCNFGIRRATPAAIPGAGAAAALPGRRQRRSTARM